MASYEAPMLHHEPFDDGVPMTRQQQAQNHIWFNSEKLDYDIKHKYIYEKIIWRRYEGTYKVCSIICICQKFVVVGMIGDDLVFCLVLLDLTDEFKFCVLFFVIRIISYCCYWFITFTKKSNMTSSPSYIIPKGNKRLTIPFIYYTH